MTTDAIRNAVVSALTSVAPEVDPSAIEPGVSFRDQLDLDSVDFLNFVLAIHKTLGVEIPEADYTKLSSLDAAVAYLSGKGAAAGPA